MRQPRPEATLLGIPTEIRLYIYAYLCPNKEDRHVNCACHKSKRHDCDLSASPQGKEPRGYLALVLSCRAIYNEAVELLYKPIIGTRCEDAKVPHILVTADQITLTGFPGMFCRKHLTYRTGTSGVFRRIRKLHIMIVAKHFEGCGCCGDLFAEHSGFPHAPDLDDRSQALDNVRWLAEQLGRPGGFDQLAISLEWNEGELDYDDVPELEDSETMMAPFKALRNVKELKIGTLGTCFEDWAMMGDLDPEIIREWEKGVAYKKKMRDILGSNAPVKENPIPLSTWLGFKRTIRRLVFFAPQVGAHKYLEEATSAFDTQDKKAFQKVSSNLFKKWKEELKQRQTIAFDFSELRQATYFDVPPGKRKEDDPEGMEFSDFTWSDPTIDKEDRATYISFLESIDYE
ncbi:hypothetical protein BFW01_g1175 [Lasiodiplodia theobromae]|uniref:DUF7730 domain-containing protein n=1 Tax=Lasiodiplodia theobromae TaxID=45133 RepID=A0A8H7IRV6_9PEZI|nr:hypothetical protein BFW01_g1175 [Lasiodiplodia theobromae]